MSDPVKHLRQTDLPQKITSEAQMTHWIDDRLSTGEALRAEIEIDMSLGTITAGEVSKKWNRLLIIYGAVSGMIAVAYATDRMQQVAYTALLDRANKLIVSTTTTRKVQ